MDGLHFGVPGFGDIDYKAEWRQVILQVIRDDLRPMRRRLRLDFPQAGVKRRLGHEPAGARMIGMALVGPWCENDLRAPPPDNLDDFHLLVASGAQAAVAEIELFAKRRAEHGSRRFRFPLAGFGRAARAHLAAGEIDDARAAAFADHLRDRTAARELDVVGV